MENTQVILLTGATGYIGRRLYQKLVKLPGIRLRLFVLSKSEIAGKLPENVEVVEGNTFDAASLRNALDGVTTAYYLIHSMGNKGDFEELDAKSASNFTEVAVEKNVARIVYLGGLGIKESASKHLRSRIHTGEILSQYPEKIQTIWFRAGIIIGSGSASFEIVRNLVQKLPVMITPKWVKTRTEPVGVDDVTEYLKDALTLKHQSNLVVDLGCGDMTFRDMMMEGALAMNLKRWMIPVPFFSPRLSSYWLILFTPVPYGIAGPLVEGLRSETVKQNTHAVDFFPHINPQSYSDIFNRALQDIEEKQVISRWSDYSSHDYYNASPTSVADAVIQFTVERVIPEGRETSVYDSISSIGGKKGWFRYHILWHLRGIFDKLTGGYGLNRGRRDDDVIRIGDSIDFWKVADSVPGKRLLLFAQMKLPGKAWLEFTVEPGRMMQTAHFLPRGLWGRIYWYLFYPAHVLIFNDMANQIIRRSMEKAWHDNAK